MQRRKKLIFWRIEQRLKQKDVAERLGMTNSQYSRIEKGASSPSYETLVKFREIFRVNDVLTLFEKETGYYGDYNPCRSVTEE